MAKKAFVFYSEKDKNELKQIKRDYPKARQRTQAVKDWATAHNRSFPAVRLRISTLIARKSYTKHPKIVVNPPIVSPLNMISARIGEMRFPLISAGVEGSEFVIKYRIN